MKEFKKHGVYETPLLTADICSHDLFDGIPTCRLCVCGYQNITRNKKGKLLRDTCLAFDCATYDLSSISGTRQVFLTNLKFKTK